MNDHQNFRDTGTFHEDGSSTPKWVIGAVIGAVALLLLAGAGVLYTLWPRGLPAIAVEDRSAKARETSGAFSGQATIDANIDAEKVRAVIRLLGTSAGNRDASRLDDIFDFGRMTDEIQRHPNAPPISMRERGQFVREFKRGMSQGITAGQPGLIWSDAKIKLIRKLDTPGDALVYAAMKSDDLRLYMRFWIHRDGDWRIYDYEDLDGGIRMTTVVTQLLAMANTTNAAGIQADMEAIQQSVKHLGAQDFPAAEAALSRITAGQYPGEVEAMRLMLLATAKSGQGQNDQALRIAAEAEKQNPDLPMLHFLRANIYNSQGQHESAEASARKYYDMVGANASACWQLGDALAGLKRTDEAVKVYRQGLDDNAESLDCLAGLARALPEDQQAEVTTIVARSSLTRDHFRILASLLLDEARASSLRALVDGYRQVGGESIDTQYYQAASQYLRQEYAPAAATFKKYLGATDDPYYKDAVFTSYLDSMIAQDKAAEGYEQSGDKEAAIAYLADVMMFGKSAELEKVAVLHQKSYPDSEVAAFCLGFTAVDRQDFAAAESHYAKAQQLATDDDSKLRVVRARTYALVLGKRAVWAYTNVYSGAEGFSSIANTCVRLKDTDSLQAVLDVHREKEPGDPMLPIWQAEVEFHRGNYASAVRLLQSNRGALKQEQFSYVYFDDRLVRSLVRLKRFDEALAEASAPDGSPNNYYQLIVYANNGSDKAAAIVRAMIEEDLYTLEDLYTDEDFGAVLKTDARFAALRREFADQQPKE